MGLLYAGTLCAAYHILGVEWAIGIAGFYIGAIRERLEQADKKQ